MEYELANEGEDALFCESTNPSLKQRTVLNQLSAKPDKLQKAECLPDEDDQLA